MTMASSFIFISVVCLIFHSRGIIATKKGCADGCICEKLHDSTDNYGVKVHCYIGGLDYIAFSNILRDLPLEVTHLYLEAPADHPNQLLWDDNLNRLRDLRELKLINCGIPAISRSLRLPSLRVLDLRGNSIDHISISLFAGIKSLKSLDLSDNRLSILPTGAFNYLKFLETLSLARNNITDFSPNLLRGLDKLLSLRLDGNPIRISVLNELLSMSPQLQRLDLNYCRLRDIHRLSFTNNPTLQWLGLAGNMLDVVPTQVLLPLKELNTLDLSDNGILSIASGAFPSNNLSRLFLARNRLGKSVQPFHSNYLGSSSLREIDLSFNNFENFDSQMLGENRHTIETLKLSGNNIRHFYNRLTSGLSHLKSLYLAFNHIEQIPSVLPKEYHNLTFLDLAGNRLNYLPSNTRHLLPSLRILDISHNQFHGFSKRTFDEFINQLEQVHLSDNPWDCGCQVDDLKRHMVERLQYRWQLNYEQTVCATPEEIRGAVIYRLNHISDCAILFGAIFGLSQTSELSLLLAALMVIAVLISLVLLLLYYSRERHHKMIYKSGRKPHSRTALTLSQQLSQSPTSLTEPLSPFRDSPISLNANKIPPPPPPLLTNF